MASLKVSGTVSNLPPGNYTVSISVSDALSNLIVESADTPVNVPQGGVAPVVPPPDVVVID